jgi:hypothetical protein
MAARTNSVPLDRRFRVFPELMQDQGLSDRLTSAKWHLGEDGPAGRGFQQYISTDGPRRLQQVSSISNGVAAGQSERTILGS